MDTISHPHAHSSDILKPNDDSVQDIERSVLYESATIKNLTLDDAGADPKQERYKDRLARLKREVDEVSQSPGVYLWKNAQGMVIYVGKAINLRARMRQYLNFQDDRAKIPQLVSEISSFEYIVCDNEHESLVLEKNLINQYSPYFNADFKDDKSYPFIALTVSNTYPAIKYTREKHKKGVKYFGPYTDGRAARLVAEAVRKVVPLCTSSCAEWRRLCRQIEISKKKGENLEKVYSSRPCFDANVGLSPGVCAGLISPEEYALNIKKVERFLQGNRNEFLHELTQKMHQAADELNFEKAARIKGRIDAIEALSSKQRAVSVHNLDADVIGLYIEDTIAGVHILIIREGRIINSNEFMLSVGIEDLAEDVLRAFILRYYDSSTLIPKEIIVRTSFNDSSSIEAWLTEKKNDPHRAKVHVSIPQKGEKESLLRLSEQNAKHTLLRYKVRTNYDDSRINTALMQLESALALEAPPHRIESFDISTIHGSYTVASMIVFEDGKPNKSQYRRFKIKTPLDEANDFLSMQEVMQRRYSPERMKDERFGRKPDLILLDGGKPQLRAVMKMFDVMGIDDIALCGLAKRDEELFVPWQEEDPIVLPGGSASLYLVKQVRDEAHRFAITYHRELRKKGMSASILDEISGLGPIRKKALLNKYKSFKRIKALTLDELRSSRILPEEVAKELYIVLQQYNKDTDTKIKEMNYGQ